MFMVVSCLCLREGEGAAASATVLGLGYCWRKDLFLFILFFLELARFGLTGFCITKSKTKPNRDFF